MNNRPNKLWIDLDNSPHVPFFKPIILELGKKGYSIVLTARDCFQVCELADLFNLDYQRIGRHYGRNKILKVAGLFLRTLQLLRTGLNEKPILAVSHGSRAQLLAAMMLRIPSIAIGDYEYTRQITDPTWMIMPEVIPEGSVKVAKDRVFRYPGIKEDVYVPSFRPDPHLREFLGLQPMDLVVTIRPPATEAHYHHPLSEKLFEASLDFILSKEGTRIIVLPRTHHQRELIKEEWGQSVSGRKLIIPEKVIDGLSLIWYSDLVISGGGTMNREAAALGVPVYSIFSGQLGAVDQYLCSTGRLTLLDRPEAVRTKLSLVRRQKPESPRTANSATLQRIVEIIDTLGQTTLSRETSNGR